MQEGLKEQIWWSFFFFFFIYSSFFLGIHRNWNYSRFSCIYRCLLLITTAEKVTWELNCSKSCNLYSCSPRLHHWSWKWERWYVEFVRKSKKSITSFVLYHLPLFNFWGQFHRLGVTLGQKSEILIEAMCDSLHRGKRCLGKAGADTCGSQDNLTAHSLGESLPQKHPLQLEGGALFGSLWRHCGYQGSSPPKRHKLFRIRNHSNLGCHWEVQEWSPVGPPPGHCLLQQEPLRCCCFKAF